MYTRALRPVLEQSFTKYSALTLVGPRQSGKTTLARLTFPDFEYISLEDPDRRAFARDDPRGLLQNSSRSLILDEIQRVPELTSYLQTLIDDPGNQRRFVLTGSHNLQLMHHVGQSLAGRTRVFELLPLSQREIIAHEGTPRPLNSVLLAGGYPAIYQRDLEARHWYKDYFSLYVERDVRSMTQITDLDAFERFVRLCAGRAGQLLNFSSVGSEAGVTQPTAKAWFSALRTTFVCFTLSPHHRNFSKRIIKTPKLYFYDTGLLCYLLGIEVAAQLDTHPLRGAIFENFVVSELLKSRFNQGETPRYFFFRDRRGLEVDVLEERGGWLHPIEIKLSATLSPSFVEALETFNRLQAEAGVEPPQGSLGEVICAADKAANYKGVAIRPWFTI